MPCRLFIFLMVFISSSHSYASENINAPLSSRNPNFQLNLEYNLGYSAVDDKNLLNNNSLEFQKLSNQLQVKIYHAINKGLHYSFDGRLTYETENLTPSHRNKKDQSKRYIEINEGFLESAIP